MGFESIVWRAGSTPTDQEPIAEPGHFGDLHLDQIIKQVTADYGDYALSVFFHVPLTDLASVNYRQDVLEELSDPAVMKTIEAFASGMREVRRLVAQADKPHYARERQDWLLQAAHCYCAVVETLQRHLTGIELQSEGLSGLRDFVAAYVACPHFCALSLQSRDLTVALAGVQFSLFLGEGGTVTVQGFQGEQDYTAAVQATFEKFRRDGAKDYRSKFSEYSGLNHIETQVLDRVALLYPDLFARLARFSEENREFQDAVIKRFDREVHFYVAYIKYTARLVAAQGLDFCRPLVCSDSKEVRCRGGFDLALAPTLLERKASMVCNDFELHEPERILVVSGANQGGKTTFARMVGQMHYLAALGLTVPAREATLFLCDGIFTHFEREETVSTLRGKLYDDVVRMHQILDRATANSIIVMNEIFSSTALKDAAVLAHDVIRRICELDALVVCVTFMAELATANRKTTSYVSLVDPADPAIRSFRVEKRPADGQAHAMALARKYGLTYEQLNEQQRAQVAA